MSALPPGEDEDVGGLGERSKPFCCDNIFIEFNRRLWHQLRKDRLRSLRCAPSETIDGDQATIISKILRFLRIRFRGPLKRGQEILTCKILCQDLKKYPMRSSKAVRPLLAKTNDI